MKKLFATLSALIVAVLASGVLFFGRSGSADAAETKFIDVYLIAGQSNAAGYSSFPSEQQTFSNVMYAGETNRNMSTQVPSSNYINNFKTSVTVGLGRDDWHIGPEYGMAEVFNTVYSQDNKALIFKSAAGGTALQNFDSGESGTYGNWLPPSQRTESNKNAATGVQYDLFIKNFKSVYSKLKSMGYTPRVNGMAWMQGESDRTSPSVYKQLITAFISDIRSDLSEIVGDDLSCMPFVMGEISDSFSSASETSTNVAFNNMLASVAQSVDFCAVIDSGKYQINNSTGIVGTDQYHWSGNDMETIGKLFGEKLMELSSKRYVNLDVSPEGTVKFAQGSIDYSYSDGNVTFTPVPDENCKFVGLKVDGAAVEPVDGVFTVTASGTIEIDAEFAALSTFSVTYDYDISQGSVIRRGNYSKVQYAEGAVVMVKVEPKDGYAVESVKFNGTGMTYDETEGAYLSTPITANSVVSVTFTYVGTDEPVTPPSEDADTPSTEKTNGCGGQAAAAAAAASIAFMALFVRKPR